MNISFIRGVDVRTKGERTYASSTWSEETGQSISSGPITVTDDGAREGIESFKYALEYVSKECSRMGME